MVRYGVFNLGQLWCVVGEKGAERGFPTRVSALDAAAMILNAHRACGEAAELLVQDTVGRLSVLTEAPSAFVEDAPEAGPPAGGGLGAQSRPLATRMPSNSSRTTR